MELFGSFYCNLRKRPQNGDEDELAEQNDLRDVTFILLFVFFINKVFT
ncbi:MAG TPA: hypothetical protein VIF64_00230 [Pyrinomonadaceae bacterium]|jgi:hypothetical protein